MEKIQICLIWLS